MPTTEIRSPKKNEEMFPSRKAEGCKKDREEETKGRRTKRRRKKRKINSTKEEYVRTPMKACSVLCMQVRREGLGRKVHNHKMVKGGRPKI